MRFAAGRTIVRRYTLRVGRIGSMFAVRVVSDDDRGLLTWVDRGYAAAQRTAIGSRTAELLSCNEKLFAPTTLSPTTWRSAGALMLSPPDASYSVWWLYDHDDGFKRWYVNLETPGKRWPGGRDCVDQALDIWIDPDGTWEWKDEDEFAAYTGRPGYWDALEAARIRAEGENVIKAAEARTFPFDGSLCDFTADPGWEPVALPWWWDQAPGQSSAIPPRIG